MKRVCTHHNKVVNCFADSVRKKFPDATPRAIKATMAQKCKYLRLRKKKSSSKTTDDETMEEAVMANPHTLSLTG